VCIPFNDHLSVSCHHNCIFGGVATRWISVDTTNNHKKIYSSIPLICTPCFNGFHHSVLKYYQKSFKCTVTPPLKCENCHSSSSVQWLDTTPVGILFACCYLESEHVCTVYSKCKCCRFCTSYCVNFFLFTLTFSVLRNPNYKISKLHVQSVIFCFMFHLHIQNWTTYFACMCVCWNSNFFACKVSGLITENA